MSTQIDSLSITPLSSSTAQSTFNINQRKTCSNLHVLNKFRSSAYSNTYERAVTFEAQGNQIIFKQDGTRTTSQNTTTLNVPTYAASRVITMPDPGANGTLAYTNVDNPFTVAQTFNQGINIVGGKAVQTPAAGTLIAPGVLGLLTAVGTSNNTTSSETNLFAGATAVPALTTLSSNLGFAVPAGTLKAGRVARLKLYGTYSTNGATATITPAIYFNTASAATKVGTGVASGTFANSAAGPFGFSMEALLVMLDGTHMLCGGSVTLDGANPATTVSGSASVFSAAAGVVIDPTAAGNISASWTGSSANAGNNFQLLAGSLELLN